MISNEPSFLEVILGGGGGGLRESILIEFLFGAIGGVEGRLDD